MKRYCSGGGTLKSELLFAFGSKNELLFQNTQLSAFIECCHANACLLRGVEEAKGK